MHVLTANDYLAKRDAAWMRPVFEVFGLRAAHLAQDMSPQQRLDAYNADITYATATEVGFDFLRDALAQSPEELVQRRGLHTALFDEADSILLDEARIPLIIAGESRSHSLHASLPERANTIAAALRLQTHYRHDENSRNVQLTDQGIAFAEAAFQSGSLFDPENLTLLTAIQDALHAHALLKRDVDYVVKDGAIELIDEFKGRIAQNRRMPAGLHTAIEAKENLTQKNQGRILGSITLQALAALYSRICGMTGTAATQAEDFWKEYKLPVSIIPPNKPVLRQDLPDALFPTSLERDAAVVDEIRKAHALQRPILVGTASVHESERLSAQLTDIPHVILNARNDAAEAEIIARAGSLGAVTISTNMAGRGRGHPPRRPLGHRTRRTLRHRHLQTRSPPHRRPTPRPRRTPRRPRRHTLLRQPRRHALHSLSARRRRLAPTRRRRSHPTHRRRPKPRSTPVVVEV
jgi:preprotein translocase subunit SecA